MAPSNLLARLGWRAERRPEPGFAHVLGAGAGVFIVFATFFVIAEVTGDDPTVPGALFNLALLVVALLVGAQIAGPVRTGAVAVAVLTVPLVWGFTLFGSGSGGDGDTRAFYALTIVSYAVLYLLLWTKGRGILLGLALLLLFSWIVGEIDNGPGLVPFTGQFSSQTSTSFTNPDGGFSLNSGRESDAGNNVTETSIASLVIGLVYLAAAAALDRKKLAGAATPFIFVGLVATISGAVLLAARESAIAGGLLLAAAGLIVGLVGGLGTDRRFSTWIGVILIVIGLSIVVSDVGDSNLGFAGLFALMALGVGSLAWLAAPRLKEFVDGDINAPKTG
jgi:hypothetical protein